MHRRITFTSEKVGLRQETERLTTEGLLQTVTVFSKLMDFNYFIKGHRLIIV